ETPSLAIDHSNKPAVAYYDSNRGDLKFAHLVGGAWQVETVDSTGTTGQTPSLVYSRDGGTAIIAYHAASGHDLRVAVQGRDGWKIRTVDTVGDVGRSPAAAIDPNDER